jgi:hypothetical protein
MNYSSSLNMDAGFLHRRRRKLIAGILLLVYATRALVPTGFMPATDHAFLLRICPEGFPAQLLHGAMDHEHGAHSSGGGVHHHGSQGEHCLFAAAGNAPPAAHALLLLASLASTLTPLFDTERPVYRAQRFHIQQPRGPPPLA